MHVIIINESSKKALLKSRRVLSRFLPQLGSSTWAGHLSEEGLEQLHAKLKAVATRQTAICCHKVVSRSRLEVAWFVGARDAFDVDGRFAFRQTAARKEHVVFRKKTSLERFSAALVKLAALFHDTGKASVAFQRKLAEGKGAEEIRHDLMSYLVHASSLWTEGVSDDQWLSRLAQDPKQACACVDSTTRTMVPTSSPHLSRVLKRLEQQTPTILVTGDELDALVSQAPGLMTVLWLVLTHHRLPGSDSNARQLSPDEHINPLRPSVDSKLDAPERKVTIHPVKECLELAAGTPPWEDPGWLAAVQVAARQALEVLPELPANLPGTFWVQLAAHHLRPALIVSDHLGSKQSERTDRKRQKGTQAIYANCLSAFYYGDTLATHELKVARHTRGMLALPNAVMPKTTLPDNSVALKRDLPSRFLWQLDLENAARQASQKGPVFVSVIAETGSGKTLAAVRCAHALNNGKFRATFALGLRSLTWQSAQSMLQDARLPEEDVVLAVGQPETLNLVSQVQASWAGTPAAEDGTPPADTAVEVFGSESACDEDVAVALNQEDNRLDWLQGLCSPEEANVLWGQRALSMLTAPVLACTADYLVPSVNLLTGGSSRLYLRLATADLILDEIDSYSPTDMQSIAKLAFVAGSYGRNVIVMSATMSPAVQQGLYEAWRKGLDLHFTLQDKPRQFGAVFASNVQPCQVLESPDNDAAAWLSYVDSVCARYQANVEQGQRRRLEMLPLTGCSLEQSFEDIIGKAQELHARHALVDEATGKRVSTGFVRLNTAKSAWRLARYLAGRENQPGSPEIRFVSYHSKFPRRYLAVLDAVLEKLASRKDPQAYLQTPALRTVLDATSARDVLVLVCTTTLIETGRDFDFDWAILEPRSVRGEVQAIGRVGRHRPGRLVEQPNVVILDKPLRALTPSKKEPLWGRPGVEDAHEHLRVTVSLPLVLKAPLDARMANGRPQPRVAMAAEALPVHQWLKAFDAQLCLKPVDAYESNRIGYLEQTVQELNLGSLWKSSWPMPVGEYLREYAAFNRMHANQNRFRINDGHRAIYVPGKAIQYWDEAAKTLRPVSTDVTRITCVTGARALIPDLQQQAEELQGDSVHVNGCSLRCKEGLASAQELTWDPLLGFLEEV